ncbi:dienelactone hydrolase family protein [Treponema zioleckii]|uniref:dienelactone hydrolase family protein n=1 Tax=Treponema zioleckii TaxID=331680 RepID=UPI00168ADD4E|nr:alpha/beta hydrolase family protein [Treponema zioleckii]
MKKILALSLMAFAISLNAGAQTNSSADYVTQQINSPDRAMPTFYEALKSRMNFSLGWKDGANPKKWKKAGLEKARELIIQEEDKTPFNMTVIEEEQREGYKAQKVVFNISKDTRTLAYLLIPNSDKKNEKFPAALMLHDHGSKFTIGKEKMVRPFGKTESDERKLQTAEAWSSKYFDETFPGDELAKRGYVVLSFDALAWGDRSVEGFKTDSQQALASNLFNMGTSFAGIIAQEDCRAAKFLASLPQVDKKHVACIGFSMGGFRSWQLAALSDDITAGVSVCWMGTMINHMQIGDGQLKGQSAFSMLHPFIAKYLDYPDVAGLAAPKPMMFINGDSDPVNPIAGINEAYEKMHKIWKANKADDKLNTVIIKDGEHAFLPPEQAAAFDWLNKQFGR